MPATIYNVQISSALVASRINMFSSAWWLPGIAAAIHLNTKSMSANVVESCGSDFIGTFGARI